MSNEEDLLADVTVDEVVEQRRLEAAAQVHLTNHHTRRKSDISKHFVIGT